MPNDDGLATDVQSRASGALYNWNLPFNQQSAAYYEARHLEEIAAIRLRETHRAADIRDSGRYRKRPPQQTESLFIVLEHE
jgi:hypothetical protein